MMPTSRASSASSNSMPPGPSDPSSIPSARNATSTGSPVRAAPNATRMLADSTAPTSRRSVPSSTRVSSRAKSARGRSLAEEALSGGVEQRLLGNDGAAAVAENADGQLRAHRGVLDRQVRERDRALDRVPVAARGDVRDGSFADGVDRLEPVGVDAVDVDDEARERVGRSLLALAQE